MNQPSKSNVLLPKSNALPKYRRTKNYRLNAYLSEEYIHRIFKASVLIISRVNYVSIKNLLNAQLEL